MGGSAGSGSSPGFLKMLSEARHPMGMADFPTLPGAHSHPSGSLPCPTGAHHPLPPVLNSPAPASPSSWLAFCLSDNCQGLCFALPSAWNAPPPKLYRGHPFPPRVAFSAKPSLDTQSELGPLNILRGPCHTGCSCIALMTRPHRTRTFSVSVLFAAVPPVTGTVPGVE